MRLALLAFVSCAPLAAGCAHGHGALARAQARTVVEITPAEIERADAQAAAADPCGTVRIHFTLDSALIKPSDRPALDEAASCLRQDARRSIMIEGNADERGTEDYNLALGDRRATNVARYLQSVGVSKAQVHTVSYGEGNPECAEHNESCWSKNRRAAIRPGKAAPATASRDPRG